MAAVLFSQRIQKTGYKTEQGAHPYTEDNAVDRMAAHQWGKYLVAGHYIACRSFPHTDQAEYNPYCSGLGGSHQNTCNQDRNIRKGDRDRFNMDISQEGLGYKNFNGDYGTSIYILCCCL